MSRTLANKTLRTLAIALACVSQAPNALASTGGTSVPASSSHRSPITAHGSKRGPIEQIATWFGPGFYGQRTACGQKMTPVIVGVASRTLPCGTLVSISFKGHQLTVPVIDRGPYGHNGATWDLTWGAASALSIEETVRIKTKVVGHAANTPQLGAPAEAQPIAGAAVAPAS